MKRSTPRFQRVFSAVSARFQRVNGSTSHVARSAISTHARAQRRACPLKIKRPLACTARARRRSISGERKTATTVQFFSLCNRCRPSLLDSSIFKTETTLDQGVIFYSRAALYDVMSVVIVLPRGANKRALFGRCSGVVRALFGRCASVVRALRPLKFNARSTVPRYCLDGG